MDRYLFQFKSGGQWYLTCNIAQDASLGNGELYYNLMSLHFEPGKVTFRWSQDILYTYELLPGTEGSTVNIVMIVHDLNDLVKSFVGNNIRTYFDFSELVDKSTSDKFNELIRKNAKE